MTQNHPEDVLTALRDELAAVTPSPEFADRVRQRIAGDLPLLREELAAVEPSPDFRARIRQRIDAQADARRASWLAGWRWLVPIGAAAAVIAIALAIVSTRRGAQSTTAPNQTTASNSAQDVRTPVQPSAGLRTAAPAAASPLRHERTGVRSSTEEPSLEVITNQPAILRALAARIAADAQLVETSNQAARETTPEITIVPIEIQPVVVKSLLERPDIPVPFPIIRIVTAELAERSPQ